MQIGIRLNRDFYIKMRLNGYTHQTITENVFPPERKDSFCNDVSGLEDIDYSKKLNIEKLVEGVEIETKTKSKIKK